MKRYMLIILVLINTFCVLGQELNFIYITNTNPDYKDRIVGLLDELYKEARRGTPTIFYLSNTENPIVAYFNVDEKKDRENYRLIQGELQERSFHYTNATADRENIISIFEHLNIPGEGENSYQSLAFRLIVSQSYWDEYKESVFGSAFFVLEMDKLSKLSLLVQLNYYGSSELTYESNLPFGPLNLCPFISNIEKIYLR